MAPEIHRPDERLAALAKPALSPTTSLALAPGDTLVVCAGFEDRALAGLALALKTNVRFHLIVVGYAPILASNHDEKIRSLVAAHCGVVVTNLIYDRENPSGFGETLVELASRSGGRIVVDISGMSRLLIVQVLVELGRRPQGLAGASVVYSEAAHYPPSRKEAEEVLRQSAQDPTFSALFLSSGVFEITIVPELSSISPAPTQSRLVVFPAFDAHHLTALRTELQPSRITLIEGTPPDPANHWRQGMIASLNHLESIPAVDRISTCTLKYEHTLTLLLELYQHYGLRERLLLAPTGSKMQTVAVGLFRAQVEDVQIVYSTPRGFVSTDNYTRGVGTTYELRLDTFAAAKSAQF